ncbi:hypothetical protein ACN2CC_02185 [Mesorhizobium muleiense]|uniref:hypothetical protein n=1 Tax=Mesorhizobium muleiense TaxID=1004279 RepID=UPI003AFA2776
MRTFRCAQSNYRPRSEAAVEAAADTQVQVSVKSDETPHPAIAASHQRNFAVIRWYFRESNKKIGRTKTQVLKSIKDFDIADMACASITSTDIVAFAREKLETGVQPQTVSNYLSHLGAVFAICPNVGLTALVPSAGRRPA